MTEHDAVEEADRGPKFVPPLYIQRYGFVRNVLDKHTIKSVVDIGCADCGIFTLLKTVPSLERITLVDLDKQLLESRKLNIKPIMADYIQPRDNPLTVCIYQGDATLLDRRMIGCQAVTMVEFIEHLEPSCLQKVTEHVFQGLGPQLVVVTTPNSDYNVLFPNFSGFRHWDHRFEWTKEEFKSWCEDICRRYGYSVEFDGIGDPPPVSTHLGHCSQAAIFTSNNPSSCVDPQGDTSYCLIAECDYPYQKTKLSADEKLALEVQYYIRQLTLHSDLEEDEGQIVIPLKRLMNFRKISNLCDIHLLRTFLKPCYKLSENEEDVFVPVDDFDSHDSQDSDSEDVEDTDVDVQDSNLDVHQDEQQDDITTNVLTEENWD